MIKLEKINLMLKQQSIFTNLNLHIEKNRKIELSKSTLYELLEKFDLDESILKKSPALLSGGEKQRIALILVLLLDREILLLDEVTSGLDHDLKIRVIEIIKDLNKTVIISSHDNQWLDYDEFEVVGW